MATDLREVRQYPPTVAQTIPGAYQPLARCMFDGLEAKSEGTHWGVYQLREDSPPPSARIASFGPGLDYWILMVYASIATRYELAFIPQGAETTQIEFRSAWQYDSKEYFSTSILPLIELCSRQQAVPQTAPPAASASPK